MTCWLSSCRSIRRSGVGDEEAAGLDLEAIFDPSAYLTHLPEIFERLERLRG